MSNLATFFSRYDLQVAGCKVYLICILDRNPQGNPKGFLTTKDTKKHEKFVGMLISKPDTSSPKFAF